MKGWPHSSNIQKNLDLVEMGYLYVVLKECAIHSLFAEGGKRFCFAIGGKTYLVMVILYAKDRWPFVHKNHLD